MLYDVIRCYVIKGANTSVVDLGLDFGYGFWSGKSEKLVWSDVLLFTHKESIMDEDMCFCSLSTENCRGGFNYKSV